MITIGLNMDLSGFISGLNAAQAATKVFAAASAAIAATTAGILSSLNKGRELAEFSEQTGISAGKLSQLSKAMDQAGMNGDDVGRVVSKMQKAIVDAGTGTGTTGRAFATLGLNIQQLSQLSGDQQLLAIGQAVHSIQDPAQRSAAAMEIFGRKGSEMVRLFNDKSLAKMGSELNAQAQVFDKNAGVFQAASIGIEAAGKRFKSMYGLFTGMAENIAPELLPMVEALSKIDLTKVGQQLGHAVAAFYEMFKAGDLMGLVGDLLEGGFLASVNVLYKALVGTFGGVAVFFAEGLANITKPDFWNGMVNALIGGAQLFASVIFTGVSKAMLALKDIPGIGETAMAGGIKLLDLGTRAKMEGGERLKTGSQDLAPIFKDMFAKAGTAIKEGYQATGDLFDTSASTERLKGRYAKGWEMATSTLETAQAANKIDLGTPGAGVPIAAQKLSGVDFTSSLAKIGGSQFGPRVTGNDAIDIARQQLEAQRRAVEKAEQTNLLLQMMYKRTGTTATVYG